MEPTNAEHAQLPADDFAALMDVSETDVKPVGEPERVKTETQEQDGTTAADDNAAEELAEQEDEAEQADDQKPYDAGEDADVAALLASEDQDADIIALRQQLAQLEARITQKTEEAPKAIEFVSEDEFDEILQNRAKLNEKFNAVFEQAALAATTQAAAYMQQQMQHQRLVDRFYTDNPDLKPHDKFVAQVSEKLIRQSPNLTQAQLFDKAALATRILKKLPIPIAGRTRGKTSVEVPQLPDVRGRAGNPRTHVKPNEDEAEFDRMLKVVGG